MSLLARMNHAIWRWLVPERHSIYDGNCWHWR